MNNKIKTFYRTWELTATPRTVTGAKGDFTFKIRRLRGGFEATLRAGKREVNEREGAEVWDQDYTNGALR